MRAILHNSLVCGGLAGVAAWVAGVRFEHATDNATAGPIVLVAIAVLAVATMPVERSS